MDRLLYQYFAGSSLTKSKSSLTLCQSAILSSFPALSCQGGDTYGNHNSVQLRFRLQRSRRYMFHILRASAFKDHPRSRKISIRTCIWKCAQCFLMHTEIQIRTITNIQTLEVLVALRPSRPSGAQVV